MSDELRELFYELTDRELRLLKQGRHVYRILVRRHGIVRGVHGLEDSEVKRMATEELRRRKREQRSG